jgi:hypothetical protein
MGRYSEAYNAMETMARKSARELERREREAQVFKEELAKVQKINREVKVRIKRELENQNNPVNELWVDYCGVRLDLAKIRGNYGMWKYKTETEKKVVEMIDAGLTTPIKVHIDLSINHGTIKKWRDMYGVKKPSKKARIPEDKKAQAMKYIGAGLPAAFISEETGININSIKKWIMERKIEEEMAK